MWFRSIHKKELGPCISASHPFFSELPKHYFQDLIWGSRLYCIILYFIPQPNRGQCWSSGIVVWRSTLLRVCVLVQVLGRNVRDFINELDNLHEYFRFSFPKVQPPSFCVEEECETSLTLHYRSTRKGFTQFVKGNRKWQLNNTSCHDEQQKVRRAKTYKTKTLFWSLWLAWVEQWPLLLWAM